MQYAEIGCVFVRILIPRNDPPVRVSEVQNTSEIRKNTPKYVIESTYSAKSAVYPITVTVIKIQTFKQRTNAQADMRISRYQRCKIRQNTWTNVLNEYYSHYSIVCPMQGYSAEYIDIFAHFAWSMAYFALQTLCCSATVIVTVTGGRFY